MQSATPSRPAPVARRAPARCRLTLQPLEAREVPATLVVTSLVDNEAVPGSLRNLIALSNSRADADPVDLITFHRSLSGKTVKLNSPLEITRSVDIDGITPLQAIVQPVISGGGNVRLFEITNPTARVTLADLVLRDGRAGPADADPDKAGKGGAIYNAAESLTISNVLFTLNRAQGADGVQAGERGGDALGGALYNTGGDLTVLKSTFSGNIAQAGHGGPVGGDGGFAAGGAIYNTGGRLTLDQNTFNLQFAFGGNGGKQDLGTVETHNYALVIAPQQNTSAGGTGTQGGPVIVKQDIGVSVTAGAGGNAVGGAVFNGGGSIIATRNTFTGNTVAGGMGGILTIQRLSASNIAGVDARQINEAIQSTALTQGGAVTVEQAIQVSIGDGGNGGVAAGAALANVGGALTSEANTYSKNHTRGGAGGRVIVGGVTAGNLLVLEADQENTNTDGEDVTQGGPITVTQRVTFSLAVDGAQGGMSLGGAVFNTAAHSTDHLSRYLTNKAIGGRGGLVFLLGGDFQNAAFVNGSQLNVNLRGTRIQQGGDVTVNQAVSVTLAAPRGGHGLGGAFFNSGAGFVQTRPTYSGNRAAGGKGGRLLLATTPVPAEGDGENPHTDTIVYAPSLPVGTILGPDGIGLGGSLYDTNDPPNS